MVTLKIKPLTVNQAWQGRRFKTDVYKKYERDMLMMLPKIKLPEQPYEVHYHFGFSSAGSDLDNPVKPLQDILQKKYGFNDNRIDKMIITREKVKKGDEFVSFDIRTSLQKIK